MRSLGDAPTLAYFIPPMPSGDQHHVISRGQVPIFYRPEDLRDKGPGKTAWVDAFEKIVVGLHLVLNGPVPYAFRTPDGQVRSLDAGCVKMMLNRSPPDLQIVCDREGYIDAVVPSPRLLDLYAQIGDRLASKVRRAGPDGQADTSQLD